MEISHLTAVVILVCDWSQVEKAESVLLEIKRLIDKQTETLPDEFHVDVEKLSDEFYEHLPHDNKHRVLIDSRQLIASKQQLCQVCVNVLIIAIVVISK